MLELRPTCENCDKALPPDSLEARICTYECTFCATCVDTVLENVCPNCGGGFVPRPSDHRGTGKATTSLVRTLRIPTSSIGPLIRPFMRGSRPQSRPYNPTNDRART